jgi:hypothetical protein
MIEPGDGRIGFGGDIQPASKRINPEPKELRACRRSIPGNNCGQFSSHQLEIAFKSRRSQKLASGAEFVRVAGPLMR